MDDITKLKIAVGHMKGEIDAMAAESLAIQAVVLCLIGRLSTGVPGVRSALLEVFDDAADMLERVGNRKDEAAAQVTLARKVIEKLQDALAGESKPKRLL